MKNIIKTISEGLAGHYTLGEIKALTRILATELLGIAEMSFFLKDEITLTAEQTALLDNAIARLQKQEPIQYILGYCDFCGLRFKVNSSTLIPRPETGELVEWVANEATGNERILDIGTGSGCIAISLAHRLPRASVEAWDISAEALKTAEENSRNNGAEVTFNLVDILNYTPVNVSHDIIVSNPPYIKDLEKQNIAANVIEWEPHTALFVPDNNPLLFYRAIAEKGKTILSPGGRLYFEINRSHGKETMEMLASLGYTDIELRKDFADNDRMIRAILP